MEEAFINANKEPKIKRFINYYNKNKKKFILTIVTFVFIFTSFFFYTDYKSDLKLKISDQYFNAVIEIKSGNKEYGKNQLKEIIYKNDTTYSPLALYFIIDENLITDNTDLVDLFDHIIDNIKFDKEEKNLIILKKLILVSGFFDENAILKIAQPIITSESAWKVNALMILGDYFFNKEDFFKAKDFYNKILEIPNLNSKLYEKISLQLKLIGNE